MIKYTLSLSVAAVVTALVGAEAPRALEPWERGELYAKNREVIETIVEKTVESSRASGEHLKRVDSYYDVLKEFSRQITQANSKGDQRRVEELTAHLTTLLKSGLAPSLDKAKGQVEGGSGIEEFPRIKSHLEGQLNALLDQLQADSPARASLDDAKAKVNAIKLPEKK